MGYDTYFTGELYLDRPVDAETKKLLTDTFALDYWGMKNCKELRHKSMPDFSCPWILNEQNDALLIEYGDCGVHAYDFVEWLAYLYHQILEPRGYKFTDKNNICWDGDSQDDFGIMDVIDGKPVVQYGERTYRDPEEI